MRIQGDLATYELSDLLQWLAQGRKSGTLVVTDGEYEHQLGFDKGRIDMSASNDPERHLDRYLLDRELIDEATLGRAARLRDATKMLSGQVLVTLGAISEEQLAEILRLKTEELVTELLTWDSGTFEFSGDERSDTVMVPLGLDVTKLLLESMEHLGEQAPEAGSPPASASALPMPAAAAPLEVPPTPAKAPGVDGPTEGLALAEVLDPADPSKTGEVPLAAPEAAIAAEVPAHYGAMAQGPSTLRRLAPLALIAVASLSAGAFYLVNRQASAQAVEPTGEPILFTAAAAPPRPTPSRPTPSPAPLPDTAPSAAPAAAGAAAASPRVAESESEQALRERYEAELAELRLELEAARRQEAEDEPAGAPAPAGELPRVAERPAEEAPARVAGAAPMQAGALAVEPLPQAAAPAATELRQTVPQALEPPAGESRPAVLARQRPPALPAAAEEPAVAEKPAPPDSAATEAAPAAVERPSLVSRPAPRYPAAARRHGHGGTVVVRLLIGKDGRVEEVERTGAKAGLGLDRAAEEAALASLWQPGTVAGEAAAMWAELRFEFRP